MRWWGIALIIFLFIGFIGTVMPDSAEESAEVEEIQQPIGEENEVVKEEQEVESVEGAIIDIPSLLGKDAFEIREIVAEELGEPSVDREPTEEHFGTLNWTVEEHNFLFGFDYWTDGSIAEALIIDGFREYGHTEEDVLRAGNLDPDSPDYTIQINPLDTEEAISIWALVPEEEVESPLPNREEAAEAIKENAHKKWEDDFRMVKYEIDRQTEAYDWLIKQTDYTPIMTKAFEKWEDDFRMVKYEYEKQVEAFESL